jgi:hypothetical protein
LPKQGSFFIVFDGKTIVGLDGLEVHK